MELQIPYLKSIPCCNPGTEKEAADCIPTLLVKKLASINQSKTRKR